MRILDGEIDLREETRSTDKARAALRGEDYALRAEKLHETQADLARRTKEVIRKIRELPNGSQAFAKEIAQITEAYEAMAAQTGEVDDYRKSAVELLRIPETGPAAIAAETAAIEALLRTRRINPNGGGGGGGSSPGGGGSGTTDQAALALIGPGVDKDADIEERGVGQATGATGRQLPAEFRDGLDAFFNALEKRGRKK